MLAFINCFKTICRFQRKKSLNEQAKEGFVEEFSSGAKWADDAVPREQNPDTTTLMNSGACGAFVHGLEDEMMGLSLLFILP